MHGREDGRDNAEKMAKIRGWMRQEDWGAPPLELGRRG